MNVRKMIDSAAGDRAPGEGPGLYQPPRNIETEMAAWLKLQNLPIESMQREQQLRAQPRKSALDAPLPCEAPHSTEPEESLPSQPLQSREEASPGKGILILRCRR